MAVITISRQYGSGGEEVATRLCDALGYRYFDKNLMAEVASEVGLSPTEIVDFAEDQYRVGTFLDRLLRRPQKVGQTRTWREDIKGTRVLEVANLDAAGSVAMVRSIIQAAYKQGSVVIVGRGGQAILTGLPGVFHVRLQAPFTDRVRRASEQEGLSLEAAQDLVAERDRAAHDYLQTFYNVDWADPALYHLVINTGQLGIEATVHLISEALKFVPAAGA